MAAAMFIVSQFTIMIEPYRVFNIIPLILAFFPFYILLFIAGILAYHNKWLERMPRQLLRFWGWFSLALIIVLPVFLILGGATGSYLGIFFGGLNWRCALMSLWFAFACISFSVTLTLWLRNRIDPNNRLVIFAGPNTFAVYLLHWLVLVPISYGLSFVTLHPLIKFLLAATSTVTICYFLADGLRRLPGVKTIL
jgi:surface polysaccharide O-acyltransferase-like enzyme